MIIHVVKQNEKINDILFNYKCEKNELISINMHITNWEKLVPGTKLKIPLITNDVIEILEETEPFVEDYYLHKTTKNDFSKEIKIDDEKDVENTFFNKEIYDPKTFNIEEAEKENGVNENLKPFEESETLKAESVIAKEEKPLSDEKEYFNEKEQAMQKENNIFLHEEKAVSNEAKETNNVSFKPGQFMENTEKKTAGPLPHALSLEEKMKINEEYYQAYVEYCQRFYAYYSFWKDYKN